ncbi:sensor domain-containing diguanylate cyclase [Acetobacter peroxydans]|uniref:sensor domain-containing diguanylate cyclase n=1 Tax=Acetobacter peroxydans TaxID=104098 RepID=UPI0013068D68|nr:diguanylate cyclase [Acetobacter peroxydans]
MKNKESNSFVVGMIFSISYVFIAFFAIKFTSYQSDHATIWPADALMLASIFSGKIKSIKTATSLTFVSDLFVHILCGRYSFLSIFYASIHAFQILLSFYAFKKYIPKGVVFSSYRSILLFNLSSGIIFPSVCALLGTVANATQSGIFSIANFSGWFFSLSLGNIAFTRPFTYLLTGETWRKCKSVFAEKFNASIFIVSILFTISVSFFVFYQDQYPFLFIPNALVIGNSLLCGEIFGSTTVMILSIIAIVLTFEDYGRISLMPTGHLGHTVVLQVYLSFMVFTERAVSIIFMRNENLVRSISAREQMLDLILSNATDCVVSVDRNGLCRWGGGACLELLGKSSSDIVGESIIEILGCNAADNAKMRSFFSDDSTDLNNFSFNSRCRTPLILSVSLRKLIVEGITAGAIVTIHDITVEAEKVDEAEERAERDQLTHLFNRFGFYEGIKEFTCLSEPVFCVTYIDIDHFKSINDTYGHEVGDLMLGKLSNILLSEMRESDIVSRFGGDEFVIATLSDKSTTKAILQRVVDRVRLEAFEISKDKKINITISCGFSSYEPGKRIDMLIQEADSALYDAKRSGRDRVCEFSH